MSCNRLRSPLGKTVDSSLCVVFTIGWLGAGPLAMAESVLEQVFDVGPNVRVSAGRPDRPHVEPSLAANPTNTDNLIAATMSFTQENGEPEVVAFVSFDRGRSWERIALELKWGRTGSRFGAQGHNTLHNAHEVSRDR